MSSDIPSTEELMQVMNFDEQDLEQNRKGELSDNQQMRLQAVRKRNTLIGAGAFAFLALCATGLMFFGQTNQSPIASFVGVIVVVCNAVLGGILYRQWMRVADDLQGGQVQVLSGEMERVIRPTGRVNNYILRIQGINFSVNKEVFKHFRHETSYHLYRTRQSNILLSAEPQ